MKIAILGAMPEEIAPFLKKIGKYSQETYANNTYYQANAFGHDLVIACCKIGKVFSTLTATILIEKYGCKKLLFSGVAGAINEDLHIGDLIIASKLCQHDVDITAFGHPYGFIPTSSIFIKTDETLNRLALEIAKKQGIKILQGVIATGDQFVSNRDKNRWINKTFKADALEMEGASVAVVCDAFGVPFFILRSISDAADMDAGFSFDKFMEKTAVISAHFIIEMLKKL